MKSITRFVPLLVAFSLLASLFLITPVSAASAGTVALDKDFITSPKGALRVTLADADLEVGQEIKAEATDERGVEYTFTGADGIVSTVRVQNFPILDGNGDGIVNFEDVTLSTYATAEALHLNQLGTDPSFAVFTVSPNDGLVTVKFTTTTNETLTDFKYLLDYTAAQVQTTTVQITSTQDQTGFDLVVLETGKNTGVFEATFDTHEFTGTTAFDATPSLTSTRTALQGAITESSVGVDLNGDGDTGDIFTIKLASITNATTTERFTTADGRTFSIDLDGDGATNGIIILGTVTVTAANRQLDGLALGTHEQTATITEASVRVYHDGDGFTSATSFAGVDLNGDGDLDDTDVQSILDFSKTVSETTAGADLNNDGDASDPFVTGIDVAGLPGSTVRPTINAATGGIVSAKYSDEDPSGTRAGTAVVETTKPLVTVKEPLDDSATRTQATRLIVEVTDADSGIDVGSIDFVIDSASAGTVGHSTILTAEIAGGFRAEVTLTGVGEGELDIEWHAEAADEAGNVGESDSDTGTEGFDHHTLRVDTLPPAFNAVIAAETGHFWDADDELINEDPTAADRTSLRVFFNEPVDGNSVQATDFTVDGVAPIAANWYKDSTSTESVFLTVPEISANAKPQVALVGDVSDKAGNTVTSLDEETAVDGIAPTIIVDPSPLLDDNEVAIDVTSDEPLLTTPNITVNGEKTGLSVVRVIGANVFRADFEPTSNTPNVYNVEVSITDTVGNVQTAGEAAIDAADAIIFEIDDELPAPDTVPIDGANISSRSPFITVDWEDEGTEYGLAAAGDTTPAQTDIDVDMDSHGVVTLTKLTLDGVDVLGQENKEGDATWVLATKDLALGDHTLVINGKDEAGNVLSDDLSVTFTVEERAEFEIGLTTGWNLISFPGDPEQPAVNDVIPLTHPIDTVLTFDPRSAAGWMIARRGDDGKFTGIDTIRKEFAYWVRTTRFESLDVKIAPIGGGTAELLPTISLAAGWNLIPVLDVTEGGAGVATTTASAYFGTVSPTRIYGYNPREDRFDQVSATTGVLSLGRGYYVYVEDADVLVP